MGCNRQDCLDINECAVSDTLITTDSGSRKKNNGGCDQRCNNSPGGYACSCNVGYELYTKNGTAGFNIPATETGLREGDVYQINKTCVPKMCPTILPPENGVMLSRKDKFHFGDLVRFRCNFGYIIHGSPSVLCTSAGSWNGTIPECIKAVCPIMNEDSNQGMVVRSADESSVTRSADGSLKFIPYKYNVTIDCVEEGRSLRGTASSSYRQCVYDPSFKGLTPSNELWSKQADYLSKSDYWLSGLSPACPRVDCGKPPVTKGATYGYYTDTRYKASFFFGCEETFTLAGKTSKNDNVIRCQKDGTWDFGDLRCEGPVCSDPGHAPDGDQVTTGYEQGSKVSFTCSKPGYVPYNTDPITCVKSPDCKVIKPLGITSGLIPDAAINATSQRTNYEARNIRLNAVTGWCGQHEPFTYCYHRHGKDPPCDWIDGQGSHHERCHRTPNRIETVLQSQGQ